MRSIVTPSIAASAGELKITTPCELRTARAERKDAGKDTRPFPSMRVKCVLMNRAVFSDIVRSVQPAVVTVGPAVATGFCAYAFGTSLLMVGCYGISWDFMGGQ